MKPSTQNDVTNSIDKLFIFYKYSENDSEALNNKSVLKKSCFAEREEKQSFTFWSFGLQNYT